MNAEIKLLDQTLSLIHIPLGLYSQFLQPILRLLLPSPCAKLEDEFGNLTLAQEHGFLNISVTPIECSIVCNETWSRTVFEPVIKQLPKNSARTVSISAESYCVLRVSSPGADAGSRVVDLTSPLALAGISIFFITTYYSDFLIVPNRSRQNVIQALFEQGFECSEDSSSSFVSPVASSSSHSRGLSQDSDDPPSTPPPSNAAELQMRTFKLLKKHNVVAHTEPNLRLIHCSGKDVSQFETYSRPSRSSYAGNGSHRKSSWVDKVDTKFYTSLVAALVSQPRFLSVTLAEEDEPSLLIDRCLLDTFGDSLIGPTDADLTPILLDLVDLPFEATGIVAGVAGKLVEGMRMEHAELSYLSTAKTGAVMLSSEYADRALEILSPLLPKDA